MLVCAAVSTTLAGRLGDVYGLRPVLLAVLAILSAGIALAAVATSIQMLAVGQAMQGIGMGSVPLSVAILRSMFPPSRVTVAVGVFVGASAIGSVLGFVLPGYVLDASVLPVALPASRSWRSVLSTFVAWMCLPSTRQRREAARRLARSRGAVARLDRAPVRGDAFARLGLVVRQDSGPVRARAGHSVRMGVPRGTHTRAADRGRPAAAEKRLGDRSHQPHHRVRNSSPA